MDCQERHISWSRSSSNLEWRRKSSSSIASVESSTSSSSRSSRSRFSSPASEASSWRSTSGRRVPEAPAFEVGDVVYLKPRNDGHDRFRCPLKCSLPDAARQHPALIVALQGETADVSIITSFGGQSLRKKYLDDRSTSKANSPTYRKHVDCYLAIGPATHVRQDWPVLEIQGTESLPNQSYLKYCEVERVHLGDMAVFGKNPMVRLRLTKESMDEVSKMKRRYDGGMDMMPPPPITVTDSFASKMP